MYSYTCTSPADETGWGEGVSYICIRVHLLHDGEGEDPAGNKEKKICVYPDR